MGGPDVTPCHLVSLQKKSFKKEEWEVGCVTYPLHWNILKWLFPNRLRQMVPLKKGQNMSKHVRAAAVKNGKLAARRLSAEEIYSKPS
jgi:hypothetical protein